MYYTRVRSPRPLMASVSQHEGENPMKTRYLLYPSLLAVMLALIVGNPCPAQTDDIPQSLKDFISSFYSWYVPIANRHNKVPAGSIAIRQRPQAFSPELYKALRNDYEAQEKVKGEIVGIDWDPFLNSQDPEEKYEVGSITRKGKVYLASIYGVRDGKRNSQPDVIVEVDQKNGKWVFVNFINPEGGDLLKSLAFLKQEREKNVGK